MNGYTQKRGSRLYTPPDGTYDLPFTWIYDASGLTTGTAYPNQIVYLQGGYGDFVMRRVVGISRLLAGTASYQIRDKSNDYIESIPVIGASADDIGYAPELLYPELGAIRFDLGAVTLPSPASTAQIAFQGVRRMKGNPPANPIYQANPKTFTYVLPVAAVNPPVGSVVRIYQNVTDYDFELHNIMLQEAVGIGDPFSYTAEDGGTVFRNNTPNPVTLNISFGVSSITVVGTTINVVSGDVPVQTIAQFIAAWNANPAVTALASVAIAPGTTSPTNSFYNGFPIVAEALSPAIPGPFGPAQEAASLWLYDSNKVQVANKPVLDIFMDGSPVGTYGDGAIVTPLWYPKDSGIQIDVYSNLAAGAGSVLIYLIGKRYFPC